MVGFAWHAVREAVPGQAGRLLLVRYESLAANPLGTLAAIYEAIDELPFAHDRENIEPYWEDERSISGWVRQACITSARRYGRNRGKRCCHLISSPVSMAMSSGESHRAQGKICVR